MQIYSLQYDIREAPSAIRDSYKMYYKLKTSFLEEALSDALDEDSFDLSILENSSQNESRFSGSFSEMSTPDVSALTSETSIILQNSSSSTSDTLQINGQDINTHRTIMDDPIVCGRREFEAEAKSSVNDKAWARETTNEPINTSLNNSNSKFRKSMSDKLFRNSSFLKRNPRKSLSRSSFSSNQSSQSLLSSSQKECLPDLETILSQKSKQQKDGEENVEQPSAPPLLADPKSVAKNVANNIDVEWLNRCHTANSIDSETKMPLTKSIDNRSKMSEHSKVFGLSNINASALASYESIQPAAEVGAKSMLSFDMSSLNLRAQNSFMDSNSMANDQVADDDDEVANSEDESELNTSRQIRSIRHTNKRKHDEIDEKTSTNILPEITSNTNSTNNNSKIVQNKHQVVAPSKAKAKSKTKQSKVPKTQSNEKIAKEPPVAVVARKSSRNLNKAKTYKPTIDDGEKSDEDSDPFAGDDSDNDPNFSVSPKNILKGQTICEMNVSSPESSDDEQPTKPTTKPTIVKKKKKEDTTTTTTATKTRKRVARVKAETKPRATAVRKAKVQSKQVADANSSISDSESHQETPDDYLLEFGIENIKSVPRMPVTELEKNTMEFTKYVCSSTVDAKMNPAPKVATVSNTKNSVAKEKLEKKIAAGSLNENYVRLNLRKKVFVRGKKTVNFSRYKKKLWKSKKAAALSGPEMDMGGCDGGILTCFQCGQPGHFAQNCKIKSKFPSKISIEQKLIAQINFILFFPQNR